MSQSAKSGRIPAGAVYCLAPEDYGPVASGESDGLRIAGLSLDCADPALLIRFYIDLLGGELLWQNSGSAGARVSATVLIAQRVSPYVRPIWPGTSIVHLDLSAGSDLDGPSARAVSLGAVQVQPQPDTRWRVLLDPAGHPFCITTVTPD
jgi:hypothetical protein